MISRSGLVAMASPFDDLCSVVGPSYRRSRESSLSRIIHERSGGLRFARGKADEDPSKAAKSPHIDSDRSKSRSPYSSTKLGFVNNPGYPFAHS
jgi:hypothetical protein